MFNADPLSPSLPSHLPLSPALHLGGGVAALAPERVVVRLGLAWLGLAWLGLAGVGERLVVA